MAVSLEAFMLPVPREAQGRRFCVLHAPNGPWRGAVLHAPAFAEEMNKGRRMVALQARALAAAGWAVLVPDLEGCGDSSGEFGQARWSGWVDDLDSARQWLIDRFGGPLWYWGLRAGCLLATELARRQPPDGGLLLWQAPASGRVLLQQFLRLAVASELLEGRGAGSVPRPKDRLASGETVNIAGYALSASLADGLGAATMEPPPAVPASRSLWFELTASDPPTASPALARQADSWRAAGHEVVVHAVRGPTFWQTTEIETAPALLAATLEALA